MFSFQALSEGHALGAHEHGVVKLAMALELNKVDIDLDASAESLLGFEYLPKSPKEKETFAKLKLLWEKELFSLMTFEKNLDCKVIEASLLQKIEGSHGDIEATAKIVCAKNLEGSDLQISLIQKFKKIKKINFDLIAEKTQTIQLKKAIEVIKI